MWLFLPCLLQPAPDLSLPTPSLLSSPHSSADLGFSALALPVLVSLLHVRALPRFSWSVLSCSEAFVQAVSLISVPPCGPWLHTPFFGSSLSSLKPSHTPSYPPCSLGCLVQSLLQRQLQFHASMSDPELLQHWWSLIPAVPCRFISPVVLVHRVCCSLECFPAAAPRLSVCPSGSQSRCVPAALSCSMPVPVFVLSTFTSQLLPPSRCLRAAERATESTNQESPASGLVPALPCSPCLLSALPSTWNHGQQQLSAKISFPLDLQAGRILVSSLVGMVGVPSVEVRAVRVKFAWSFCDGRILVWQIWNPWETLFRGCLNSVKGFFRDDTLMTF